MEIADGRKADDFLSLEGKLPILVSRTGIALYDFDFRQHFQVSSLLAEPTAPVLLRTGPLQDYAELHNALDQAGIPLLHSPEENLRASLLPNWYPLLADLTPKSMVYDVPPSAEEVEDLFGWPVFVKGERQTSRHAAHLSILRDPEGWRQLLQDWGINPILHWQRMVCRKFEQLQRVGSTEDGKIPKSHEFRIFYWHAQRVGVGRYWTEVNYDLSPAEEPSAFAVGDEAARRLNVPFLAVDIARKASGEWIVIEVNDGQESGYAGVNRMQLWRNILALC